ncbi:MAG: amino acid transporter, partial [Desulfobacteria bacterium]
MPDGSIYQRIKRVLLGAPRDLFDPKIFHNVSLIAFFAWVGLGADGISSSSYGPEEAYLALGGHTVLALFVAAATVLTVFIISGSYAQIIE